MILSPLNKSFKVRHEEGNSQRNDYNKMLVGLSKISSQTSSMRDYDVTKKKYSFNTVSLHMHVGYRCIYSDNQPTI